MKPKVQYLDVDNEKGWNTIIAWLPKNWKDMIRETRCFERPRNIKRPEDYLRILFAYPALQKSLEDLSRWAEKKGIARITPESLWVRMQNATPFLSWLVGKLIKPFVEWGGFTDILAPIDGTTFTLPGSNKRDYIIHMLWSGGHPIDIRLSKAKGKGSGESLKNLQEVPENVIILADRAYGTPPQLSDAHKRNRRHIVRFTWNNLPLYADEEKNPIDPFQMLADMKVGEIRQSHAWIHPKGEKPFKERIVVIKKDQRTAENARKRSKKESSRKGHKPLELTVFMTGFVTLATNLGENEYPKEYIAEAYRWRYQIEREFKRFKSTTKIRKLVTHKDAGSQVYLLAAFAVWLITHRIAHESAFFPWGYPLV